MKIEVHGARKRYGPITALDGVTIDVASGHRIGLAGPNGSGKTTLIRALMGLVRCEGTLRLGGFDAWSEHDRIAPDLAYVPQIAPAARLRVAAIVETLAAVREVPIDDLAAVCERLELDLRAIARKDFSDLSGGMKQKLLVALALARPGRVLLLDEPTASLDPRARTLFFHLLEEASSTTTVLLCSHRVEEIRQLVDEIVILDRGSVTYRGPVDSYLAGTTTSVLLVRTNGHSEDLAEGLGALGFTPHGANWWERALGDGEKVDAVREVTERYADAIEDIIVRDHERISPEAPVTKEADS